MTVRQAKLSLSIGWLLAVGPLVIILVLRQLDQFYSDPKDVWSWFSQFVLPGLTLLGGAWTVSTSASDGNRVDNPAVFWIAAALSVFYFVLIYVVIGKQAGTSGSLGDHFKDSALFLGVIQGLVIGVLGKFFIESGR